MQLPQSCPAPMPRMKLQRKPAVTRLRCRPVMRAKLRSDNVLQLWGAQVLADMAGSFWCESRQPVWWVGGSIAAV